MNDKWKTSVQLLARARQSLAGGVSSPFRAMAPVPLYFREGCGARLIDEDGHGYIDYALAWGPAILGHCHPKMVEAMTEQARRPVTYGAQHWLEIEVAERIRAVVPCAERLVFSSSGSEAVQLALRLARAYTGRNLILKFEGHYHGWFDSVLVSYHPSADQLGAIESPKGVIHSRGQAAGAAENLLVLPWNDADQLDHLFGQRGSEIAGVIMEPVLCNSGCLMPRPGYLQRAREITRKHGALLIFDEVITGFRIAPAGAQGFFNVTPDLATFGKAVGGGLPLSVIAGRQEIMEMVMTGGVAFGGSFNGNPVALTGAKVALEILTGDDGSLLAEANRRGRHLMEGIAAAATGNGFDALLCGFGAAFGLHFTRKKELADYRDTLQDDRNLLTGFIRLALAEGIYLLPDGRFYVSVAHTDADIDETLAAVNRALRGLRNLSAPV